MLALAAPGALAAEPDVTLAAPAEGDPFSLEPQALISLSVAHAMNTDEAITRLGYLLSYWKSRFDVSSEWHGHRVFLTGMVFGVRVRALFSVEAGTIVAFAQDPGWFWRAQALRYVERKLKKYVHPTYEEP